LCVSVSRYFDWFILRFRLTLRSPIRKWSCRVLCASPRWSKRRPISPCTNAQWLVRYSLIVIFYSFFFFVFLIYLFIYLIIYLV
jgi:hypothetical protein